MLLSSVLAIFTLVAAPAAAHFELTKPAPRGFNELIMDKAPCGGFDTPLKKRVCFGPKSVLSIAMADTGASMTVKLGSGSNPRSFPFLMSNYRFTKEGNYNLPAKFANLPKTFTNNSLATIQLALNSEHGTLYQCADVTICL
ncbi:hypothetical protein BASA50_010709 [Batrachochytrium salamandrivorans]|uniref:Copper acquisition factor BIM1-like domain-containing protein n=1 Tax=Batrachochytrium salamandrivorans TaxID=1357716 RepID=A0ABQ8EXP2_9FUNG|nr:hypothetical protein BASA50_010709 [Batrachochytrium salamandrivorans]KAH9263398.1 hypothetical protein BASA83_013230 [Batrachochytrium salamandrivorans]